MAARILIVDDEEQITGLLKDVVESALTAVVEVFTDSTDAFNRLQQQEFDVLSLDHRMPGLTGMALTKLLRMNAGLNQKTPILVFTGYLEEAKHEAPVLEDVIFLEKPVKVERYLTNIKLALEMKRNSLVSAS